MKDYFNGKTEEDKKIMHLFVTNKCTHFCKYCCNKEYDIDDIPVATVKELKTAEAVCLTGGEPFLIDGICMFAKRIKEQYPNIQTGLCVYLRRQSSKLAKQAQTAA